MILSVILLSSLASVSLSGYMQDIDPVIYTVVQEVLQIFQPKLHPGVHDASGQTKIPEPCEERLASSTPSSPSTSSEEIVCKQRIFDNKHWKQLSSFNVSTSSVVTKYRSELTGLTVVITTTKNPIVEGEFCLPTEVYDNDGLPHTLEHLIFLGSEDYPYKDALDLLANRCLAKMTGGSTYSDATCYEVSTAESEGFLRILPVFLDHILYPLLRDDDYLTEVHHINGEGVDAGVVYNEMQGVEQTSITLMDLEILKILYPQSPGYQYEQGGILKNLRESTNNQKVRDYHKKFYRPENLVLSIIGNIEDDDVFSAIRQIEEKILKERCLEKPEPFVRPWQNDLPKIPENQSKETIVVYPSNDESFGLIDVAWRLPVQIPEDFRMKLAYDILLDYLTQSQVSPFQAEFVYTQDPWIASVTAQVYVYKEPAIIMEFENVPMDRIDLLIPRMENVLKKIVSDGPEQFDIERIHNYIDSTTAYQLKDIENGPHLLVPESTQLDTIYGQKVDDLELFVLSNNLYQQYRNKDAGFWLNLIDEALIKTPKYYLKGIPSIDRLETLARTETERIEKQRQALGPDGLMAKQKELERAVSSKTRPSSQVLNSIPLGDVNSIKFISFDSYNRTLTSPLLELKDIPFKIQLVDVKSKFVEISLLMDTTFLSNREKSLLTLLMAIWFDSPIKKGGEVIPLESVYSKMSRNLLYLHLNLGFDDGDYFLPGTFSEAFVVEAQAEIEKFGDAMEFLSDLLNYPYFTDSEIITMIQGFLNSITAYKQSMDFILRTLYDGIYYNEETNIFTNNFIRQEVFLTEVLQEMEDKPGKVVGEMYDMIRKLTNPNTAFIYLGTEVEELTRLYGNNISPIINFFNSTKQTTDLSERFKMKIDYEYRRKERNVISHVIHGAGATESCNMKHSIYYNNSDWNSDERADLTVMLQFLTSRLFDQVRGPGLVYSLSIQLLDGRIFLSMDSTSRLTDAFRAVRDLFNGYIADPDSMDSTLLDSARGSTIFQFTKQERTLEGLISKTLESYLTGLELDYNRNFVKALAETSTERIKKLGSELLPVFMDSSQTQTVIVCNPSVVNRVIQEFKQFDIHLSQIESLEDSFLTG